MADDISDLRLFTELVSAGSLSAAARHLGSSPAAMSRRLAAVEARIGVRLVVRTTRRFELTPEGRLFYERCQKIVAEIDEAEAEAAAGSLTPRGPLRIGVPLEIGRRRIAPLVAAFVADYPEVQAHLVLADSDLDLMDEHLDVALKVGLPAEPNLVATKILSGRLIAIAAPSYIERNGMPSRPADLAQHRCIGFYRERQHPEPWVLLDDEGGRTEFNVRYGLSTTSAEVVHDWVLAGHGVGLKALWDVQSDIDAGRLRECLADRWCRTLTLYAVYASRKYLPPRVRLFIDHVRQGLR